VAAILCVLLGGCSGASLKVLSNRLLGGPYAVISSPPFVPSQIGFWSTTRGIALSRSGQWMAVTTDGGQTWRIVRHWLTGVASLSVARHGAAAVLGDCRPSTGCRLMWRSRDHGRSWASQALRRPATMLALARSNSDTGWSRVAESDSDRVSFEATYDGGKHWHAIRSPCSGGWTDSSPLSLATPRRGWIICTSTPGGGFQEKQLYETSDGAAIWTRLIDIHFQGSRPQFTGGLPGFGYPTGLSMTADGYGLLAMGRDFSWRTRDGGRHWRPLHSITRPDTREGFGVSQLSATSAVMFVFSGGTGITLYRTTDSDRHWLIVRRWRPV
jgi:photosystem II stability/assembly factor-like uncharacterized protein